MALALATKLQKPRPERRTDDGLLPATVADLKHIARASPPFYEGARGESTKRRGQRARLPQSKALGSNRRSCAFKQPTPSVEIPAALASTRAERSLKVVTAVGPSPAFPSRAAPRATTACEAQARATAPV